MKKNKDWKIHIIILVSVFMFLSLIFIPFTYTENPEAFTKNIFYRFDNLSYVLSYILRMFIMLGSTFLITKYILQFKKRWNVVLDTIPQIVCIFNDKGAITYLNKFGQEHFNYQLEDIIGKSVLEFIDDVDKQRAILGLQKTLLSKSEEKTCSHSYTLKNRDGTLINAIFHLSYNVANKMYVAIINDTSEIDIVRKTGLEQIDFFWSLLENMPIPVSYNDVDGKYVFINHAYRNLVQLDELDLLGNPFTSLLEPKVADIAEKKRQYVMNNKKPIRYDSIEIINNEQKILSIDVVPRIAGDEVIGTFSAIKDITSEKQKELHLKREVMLNRGLNEISELMSIASDETLSIFIDEAFSKICNILNVDRCYLLMYNDVKEIEIKYEHANEQQVPYEKTIIEMPKKHKEFYSTFMKRKTKIIVNNIKLSKYSKIQHFKMFNSKSIAEVSITKTNIYSSCAILGASSSEKLKIWKSSEIEFLFSAGRLILNTIEIIKQIQELKLSEETLSILIDNTDTGMMISGLNGEIHFANDRITEIIGTDLSEHVTTTEVLRNFITPSSMRAVKNMFSEREYKGKTTGIAQAVNTDGKKFYVKIYSVIIDYEGSKAYLTTMIDIDKYIK